MTVLDSLRSMTPYPVPPQSIINMVEGHGIDPYLEVDAEIRESDSYRLAMGDFYRYLASAPTITQNGVSFSFSQSERDLFLSMSRKLVDGVDTETSRITDMTSLW